MLQVTFEDTVSRDAFADRFKVTNKIGDNQLEIGWHLLQAAKLDPKVLDYDEVTLLTGTRTPGETHEFIVKGDPANFLHIPNTTVKQDLGKGFYLIETSDGTTLGDFVDTIESNKGGMSLMGNVSSVTEFNGENVSLDPTAPDNQWHRIRVVSRYRPLLSSFATHDMTYFHKPEVYIFDSGINFNHAEFDYPEFEHENFYTCFDNEWADDIGHGTAVASMVAGKNLGISSYVKICNVKIGNVSGTTSLYNVGLAIDAVLNRVSQDPTKTRIVNMSWGTARSSWLDTKVQALIDAGVTVVCAAGNNGINVEDISPAGIISAITVASIDKYDIPSGFNDIAPSDAGVTTGNGLALDIFAPGESILVANKDGGYSLSSGTSFSAPIVAGVGATIAALRQGITLVDTLKDMILSTSTKDALLFEYDKFSDNQNNLVYLYTADTGITYKTKELSYYLGVHDVSGEPIVTSLKTGIDTSMWTTIHPEDPVVWSVKFLDSNTEAVYGQYFDVNSTTAVLSIAAPQNTLPPETKLRPVEFLICATNGILSAESNMCFFFDVNPLYVETRDTDITLALTETNSISYYHSWNLFCK